jgi:hypothetical protein
MMGSLFSSKTPEPPFPPPPSIVRDEINKVEQVPVVNPDGSITFITRSIETEKNPKRRAARNTREV